MSDQVTKLAPSRRFLALALGFGLLLAIVNPPFAVNDEDVHLARIYELAEGRWLTRSDEEGEYHMVPPDYVELGTEYERVWQRPHGRVGPRRLWRQLLAGRPKGLVRRFGRAGSYPPLLYVPHTAALWLARQFDTSVLVHLYMVRLAALLAYVWLAFRAVAASTHFQWLFIIVGLTPMVLTQAAAVSGDGLVIGLSMLCFALVGKGACAGKLSRFDLASLILAVAALTLFKPIYGLLVLSWPALPWLHASSASAPSEAPRTWLRWLFPLAAVVVAVAAFAGWRYINRNLRSAPGSAYDSLLQLAWLRENYGQLFAIGARTLFQHGDELLLESVLVRNKISGVMRFAPAIAFVLHTQLALATAWGSGVSAFPGTRRARYFAAACFAIAWLAIVLAIPLAFYVCCTKIGAPAVRVMQGRYFVPALPALLIALSLVGRPVLSRWLRARGGAKIFALSCFLNVLCVFCLIGWHYFSSNGRWPF